MCETTERAALRLPLTRTSPAAARAFVRSSSCPEHAPALLDDAQLLISELVTNAVLYGEPPLTITLDCEDGSFKAAVRDAAPAVPQPHDAAPDDEGGRGLALVEDLSDAWGVETVSDEPGRGKAVWFELHQSGGRRRDTLPSVVRSAAGGRRATSPVGRGAQGVNADLAVAWPAGVPAGSRR